MNQKNLESKIKIWSNIGCRATFGMHALDMADENEKLFPSLALLRGPGVSGADCLHIASPYKCQGRKMRGAEGCVPAIHSGSGGSTSAGDRLLSRRRFGDDPC